MDRPVTRAGGALGPGLTIAGATGAMLGCLLPWFDIRTDLSSLGGPGPRATTAHGLETSDGILFLLMAAAIAAVGVATLVATGRALRIGLSAAAALGALSVAAFGAYDELSPRAQAIEAAAADLGPGNSIAVATRFFERLFSSGILSIDAAFGLWIVVGGAVVALAGALAAVATTRPPTAPPVALAPAPPSQAFGPPASAPDEPHGPG